MGRMIRPLTNTEVATVRKALHLSKLVAWGQPIPDEKKLRPEEVAACDRIWRALSEGLDV